MAMKNCGVENRRAQHFTERGFSESLLGHVFSIRIYARHGDVARGTLMLACGSGYRVHTAYLYSANSEAAVGGIAKGIAVGVLFDRGTNSVSIMLADESDAERVWTQSQIAEAVDYWESGNMPRIYCLREKSCGAVVFTEDGDVRRYLVIRMNLGHCGLPKGHVEKYETEHDTAIREVREETGVEITLLDGFRETVVYSLSARTTKESVYFLGRFSGDHVTIQESEVSAYRLCGYDEARRMITYENDRAVLDAAHAFLNKKSEQ